MYPSLLVAALTAAVGPATAVPPRGPPAVAPAAAEAELATRFERDVRPFLAAYCVGCHGAEKPKADLDLGGFADLAAVVRGHRQWQTVAEALSSAEMPPSKAPAQPRAEERSAVLDFIQAVRRHEAHQRAGDPGPVLARRLSNAEYDYTIRDLTGVDLRPTREFPVDPANEAGFDNSGESLAMSPALLKKYLEAARGVAEHLVLRPTGLAFAPHPVVTETDRDRYAVQNIVRFYAAQPTDLARYFQAAWRFKHRAPLGQPGATLPEIARAEGVSPRYLALVWQALERPEDLGPLATVQRMWRELPGPGALPAGGERAGGAPDQAPLRARCAEMRDFILPLREKLTRRWMNLRLRAVATGSQPFILWKNRQFATHRRDFDPDELYTLAPGETIESVARTRAGQVVALLTHGLPALVDPSAAGRATGAAGEGPLATLREVVAGVARPDPDLAAPAGPGERARFQKAVARFAAIFPDAFYVSERGRMHLDRPKEKQDKGRLLSAGYHNMFGYFRDDQPLYELILDERGRRELDGLWRELDLVTNAPRRQHADFIFYERAEPPRTIRGPEFDFVRSEDRASASAPVIRRLAQVYLAKARQSLAEEGGDAITIPVLEGYFRDVAANIQRVDRDQRQAEPHHLRALLDFAAGAYRRPLSAAERAELRAFYTSLRREQGLSHEDAVRDTLASVLVSPHFLYRIDLVAAGPGSRPLPPSALASRLSYFLWSSQPDAELRARAAAGDLGRPAVLAAQVRRMLSDPRARALAVEFGGQWLDFRRFQEHNGVDRQRFPSFDDQLRRAMFEEPVHFFADVIRQDRSVLDFLFATHTFVNPVLARHYGIPFPAAAQGQEGDEASRWVRVDGADRYQRGGILPMAVFLTANSPGLRTSPVKRGYWVVRRALGEQIPPPPAQVPDLPNDEAKMGNLTLRQALEAHRQNPACGGCHARFDSFGLVFEGYGPVGETRDRDLGGRPVDTAATFPGPDRREARGLAGLRGYLREHRQDDFVDNLVRKLMSYAYGRSLLLSDDPTVDTIKSRLAASGHRFGDLVESVVLSPQFLHKRAFEPLAHRSE